MKERVDPDRPDPVEDSETIVEGPVENDPARTRVDAIGRSTVRIVAPPCRAAGGPSLGRHEHEEVIGRGGMATVVRAWDPALNRHVAIKYLQPEIAREPFLLQKFLAEAQLTGQLEHPNIVPVHELAISSEGRFYFSMKLVDGQSLGEVIRGAADADVPRARLLSHFLKVCDAIAFAHSMGVVHRDLKPDNVMIGRFGEVLVMDWGLAKILESSAEEGESGPEVVLRIDGNESGQRTQVGAVLGTPSYMSPEQAEGEPIDRASDVYALGAILYSLLALAPPYADVPRGTVLDAVRLGPPAPPSSLPGGRDVPAELEAVTGKAMARRAADRYATVEELKADVEAFLDRRELKAYSYSAPERVRKWVGRNQAFSLTAAAGLAALVVLGAFSTVRIRRQNRALEASNAQIAAERDALTHFERGRRRIDRARSLVYIEGADYGSAREDLEAARLEIGRGMDLAPELPHGPFLLGLILFEEGDILAAVDNWLTCLERDPGYGPAHLEILNLQVLFYFADRLDPFRLSTAGSRMDERFGQRLAGGRTARIETAEDRLLVARYDIMEALIEGEATRAEERALETIEGERATAGLEEVYWLLAVARQIQRSYGEEDILEPLAAALRIAPNHYRSLVVRASVRARQGRFEGATRDLLRACEIYPRGDQSVAWLAQISYLHIERGDLVAARSAAERALELAPDFAPALGNLAVVEMREGNPDRAQEIFDGMAASGDRSFPLFANRAKLFAARGDREAALRDLDRAIAIDPAVVGVRHERGLLLTDLGRYEEAIRDYDVLLEIDPADELAWNRRGYARWLAGDLDRARSDLDEAARLRPDWYAPLLNRGSVRRDAGDLDGALADLDRAIEMSPILARAWYERGRTRHARGELDPAIVDLEAAVRLAHQEESRDRYQAALDVVRREAGR